MLDTIKTGLTSRFRLAALTQDRRGVTAVEYAVIAALIIGTVAVAFTALAGGISGALGTVTGLM
jgi:Flp pilus assembly pilin Flp